MPDDPHVMSAEAFNEFMANQKPGKYRNVKTVVDSIQFDSGAEAKQYANLKHLERVGELTDLELQPVFPLIINGITVAQYRADFRYKDADGKVHVQDVKSEITRKNRTYRLKAKMVRAIYGIEIEEIEP